MAIPNMTSRKRATHSPDSDAVVMLSKIKESTVLFQVAPCRILGEEGTVSSAVITIGLLWFSRRERT
jgi:hypothetical protein